MAALRPTSEMKDSGIEWAGIIPGFWNMQRLKNLVTHLTDKADTNTGYNGLENVESFSGKFVSSTKENFEAEGISLAVKKGDLIFGKLRPYLAKCAIVEQDGCCSTEFVVMRADKCSGRFLKYIILSPMFIDTVNMSTYGAKMPRANWDFIGNMMIPFPSLSEQHAITSYLDDRCSMIDEIITKAEKSIEEYKELKQAVIFEAVTKGLDKNVPMKNSGVDWIGELPSSWSLVRIPRILDYRDSYPLGDGDHGMIKTEDYQNDGIPYIRVQNLGWGTDLLLDNVVYISEEDNEKIKSSQLKPNDVLFCKTGGTIGKTGMVPVSLPVSNTTSHVGKITVNPDYNARYVFYVLSSYVGYRQFWEIACQKTTRPELSIAETRQIRLTWPSSRQEQDDIVQYLDNIIPEYNVLIAEKQSLVEDLKAYKKSLIYEVVTGKRRIS